MLELPEQELCALAVIENQRGLHARAAAKFVRLAGNFNANVSVAFDTACVSGNSIMGLMMLAASKGAQIKLCASGPDAETAIEALSQLIKRKFDEDE